MMDLVLAFSQERPSTKGDLLHLRRPELQSLTLVSHQLLQSDVSVRKRHTIYRIVSHFTHTNESPEPDLSTSSSQSHTSTRRNDLGPSGESGEYDRLCTSSNVHLLYSHILLTRIVCTRSTGYCLTCCPPEGWPSVPDPLSSTGTLSAR